MWRLLVVLGLVSLVGVAAAQVQPVATISFDQDYSAAGPTGAIAPTLEGKPELAPGKSGQALKSGPGTGYLHFPTAGLLKPEGGTVEMWVCPLDWQPGDKEFHAFFDTRGQGALYLYKYVDGNRLLMLSCDNVAGPYYSVGQGLDWKPGEWHHIAGTWSSQGLMVYVDGKPANPMPIESKLPVKLGTEFVLGDHPWHLPRTSSSLVDEVRLYDRPLSPVHIAAHYAGNYAVTVPLTAQQLTLGADVDPAAGQVRVRLDTQGADVTDAQLGARLALVPQGQGLPADAAAAKFTAGQVTSALKMPEKPGNYEIVAEVSQDGKVSFTSRKAVVVPDTSSWLGSMIGLEDKVLPPWTPVKVKDHTVSVWGREYRFSGGNDIKQITSGGQPLLAAPITMKTVVANQSWVGAAPAALTVNRTGTRAVLDRPTILPGGLFLRATVEYDGLAKIELSGRLRERLEALSVDIPLRPEIAVYRHRYSGAWDSGKVTGNLPAGDGVIDRDKFIPYYWLGNNDRGLFWMCESDEMWPNGQSPDAIQVIREGGKVTLRLNLLAKGQKLPENWKFTFALQATPVKPLPKDWRKWRLLPGRNGNVSIYWPTPQKDSIRYFGYPEATTPDLFKARVAADQAKQIRAVPYLCLSFLSAACPEWPYFRRRWAMGPVDMGSADVAQYGAGFAMVSPVGDGYSDFIVSKTGEFIEKYGINGLYHDNTHPYGSPEKDAGLGYERDGQLYPTYPIFGYRDLYRRMYAVLKARPGETFSMAHMSGKMTIPILAYEDSYLDGEHFRGVVKDSYLDFMSLDTFRAEYMGRQWGIMPFFLPEFHPPYDTQVEPTRGLMALLMLHDTAVWPIWCNADVVNQALAALDDFGYVNADFIGYFDSPAPATTDLKDVYVSAYRKTNGEVLLIVGNVGREPRSGQIRLNRERLGIPGGKIVSWPAKEAVATTGDQLAVSLAGLDYRMYRLSK